jgi:hypothetical protein
MFVKLRISRLRDAKLDLYPKNTLKLDASNNYASSKISSRRSLNVAPDVVMQWKP